MWQVTTVFDSTGLKHGRVTFDITKSILCQWNILPWREYLLSLMLHVFVVFLKEFQ